MIKLIAQFDKHSGPQATGLHKLTFDIIKEHAPALYSHLAELEKNPQLVLYIEVLKDQESANEILNETEEERWTRYNKKIHALFDQLGEIKKITGKEVKEAIKDQLIKKKTIKTSLKELNHDQQLDVINKLEELVEEKSNG